MKSILFPTDFSSNANRALEYAVEIAVLTNATLHLLYVYTPIVSKTNVVSALITDEVEDAKKEGRNKLDVIKKTIQEEFPSISCDVKVRAGETVEEILDVAKDIQTDIIIMGTRGVSNITKMLFGSNTAAIIEQASCPVLAVPSNITYRPPKRILFATNYSDSDLDGVKTLAPIAEGFKSEIIIGHVDTSIDEDSDETVVMENFLNEVRTITSYPKIDFRILNDHNVSMGLDKMIEEDAIDIFALTTHKRTWIEKIVNPSLTKKISEHISIPLLAFHNPIEN